MKKLILATVALLAAIVVIMFARASAIYEDVQPEPATDIANAILDEQAVVQRYLDSLRFRTISYDDRSNFDADAFLALHEHLRSSFPLVFATATVTTVGDYSLVFHVEGTDDSLKPVLFMGHLDVVPIDPNTVDQWEHDPFGGTVADGVIWGRGTLDDKVSVMSFLEATEALLQDGHRPTRSLYLAFGHDEEVGGRDGAQKISKQFADAGIEFEFVLDEGGVVTEGILSFVERPVAIIGVAEKGYVNLRLTVEAQGGHSSQPPDQTALGIVSRAVVRVEENPFPPQLTFIQQTFKAIAPYSSFGNRFALANTWLLGPVIESQLLADRATAATLRTTTAATMASGSTKSNVLPTRAELVINFRIIPGETAESVRDRVVEIIDDERVTVTMESVFDPSPVSPTDSWGYELLSSMIRGFDDEVLVAPYLVQGGTDARFFHAVSPNVYRFIMVRANPDTLKGVHGINERIPVEDYLTAIRFYYAFMKRVTE